MASFIDDNLLKTSDTITHDGENITENEVISPSLENDHLGVVTSTYIPAPDQNVIASEPKAPRITSSNDYTSEIVVDPDKILSVEIRNKFIALHKKHNSVFDPNYKGYDHSFGRFEAVVNMGTVLPPQMKGKLPQYSRDKLALVQEHFNHLEKL